jgi:S1-C subfamily serine protease
VIGINSQIETGGGSSQGSVGIAFAIPVNTAKQFMPSLRRGNRVQMAYLGADGVPAPGSQHGVILRSVQRGSPAARAGHTPGVEIMAVTGRRVATISDVLQVIDAHLPGQTITIRSRRGNRVQTFAVKLGSKSQSAPQ